MTYDEADLALLEIRTTDRTVQNLIEEVRVLRDERDAALDARDIAREEARDGLIALEQLRGYLDDVPIAADRKADAIEEALNAIVGE